jgi:outer membrane protein assembly factor BamB
VLSSCDWPQPRFGPEGTGFNPFESGISTSNVSGLQQRWSESSLAPFAESSPIVANGVVYANSAAGRLDAFDASTGAGKWSFQMSAGNVAGSVISPAEANGVVYDIGGGCNNPNGCTTLYAIDASSGIQLWSSSIPPLSATLVVANGIVYVSSNGGNLWAFNASTGVDLWDNTPDIDGPAAADMMAAVANGIVYTKAANYNYLYAQSATSGAVLWSAQTTDATYSGGSSPTVANGIVYVYAPGKLSAFNATTGAPLWSDAAGAIAPSETSPAVANGVVYLSSNDGKLAAFDATTGAPIWSSGTSVSTSSPVLANGVVYVGGTDRKLEGFNATTGTLLWSSGIIGSVEPVVDNGVVYAGSNDGHIYAFSLPVSGVALTVSPTFVPDYGTVLDGTSSTPTTFMVHNFGSTPTSTLTTALTGADPTQFNVTSDTCAGRTLAGGVSCTVEVAFAPTLPGVRTASLAVSAGNGGSVGGALSGTGNALTIDPKDWDFGGVLDGTTPPPKTFTVTNHSESTVSPIVGSLAGTQITATSDTCSGATLTSGANCSITVTFTPTGIQCACAGLSVSTAPGVTTTATLTGTSRSTEIVPSTEHYGTVPLGSSSSAIFTITNVTSFGPGTAYVSGSGFSVTSDGCQGTMPPPGTSCTVVVTFAPSTHGSTYRGQLTMVAPGYGFAIPLSNPATLVGTGG